MRKTRAASTGVGQEVDSLSWIYTWWLGAALHCRAGQEAGWKWVQHVSARVPLSAYLLIICSHTQLTALTTETRLYEGQREWLHTWRDAEHMCICLCSLYSVSRDVIPTAITNPAWYCMCYSILLHKVQLSWLF